MKPNCEKYLSTDLNFVLFADILSLFPKAFLLLQIHSMKWIGNRERKRGKLIRYSALKMN
jgi:hypothetical protein